MKKTKFLLHLLIDRQRNNGNWKIATGNILLLFVGSISCCIAQIPQNPFAPNSSWPEAHGTYCQQHSPVASLTEFDSIIVDSIRFPVGQTGDAPGGGIVSDFYGSSNTYCFWGGNGRLVFKAVCSPDTTILIYKKVFDLGGDTITGNYGMMDNDDKLYFLSGYKLLIVKDSLQGDPFSAIIKDTIVDLSSYQNNDILRGIKMLYSGEIVLTSTDGNIFIIDRITRSVLFQTNIGHTITNNMAVDEGNNVYIISNTFLYKFHWDGTILSQVWNVLVGASGSTPTLIGENNLPAASQLVAIVDKDHPMKLILVWKDSIPAGWTGISGYLPRVAAVQPITFNTANPAQDVLPTGNSVVVENKSILLARWTGMLPLASDYNPGLEKWTWNPSTKTLAKDWVDTTIYLPNAVQALSTAIEYFYSIGEENIGPNKYWVLEGIDWLTGTSRINKILGPHNNSALNIWGSGILIGPFGEILTMSPYLVFRFRKAPVTTHIVQHADNENKVTVFPNPAAGSITLDAPPNTSIEIFDMEGQIVKSFKSNGSKTVIDLEGFSLGVYFLKARTNKAIIIKKFIKD